jgi:hypothetical protein
MRAAVTIGAGVLALGLPSAAQASPTAQDSGAVTTLEQGHVLSCTGQAGEQSVAVELYENSLHGSFVNVSVEGPDGQYGGSSTPSTLFDQGTLDTELPINRLGDDETPAGTAIIKGVYTPKGKPELIHDVYEDDGWTVVSTGNHHRLKAKVQVDVLGETVRLTCANAFTYDLEITKTPW